MKNNLQKMLDTLSVSSYTDLRTLEKIFNRGKTMRIHNYTPHEITIVNGALKIRLPSEGVIRAKSVQTQVGTVYHEEATDSDGHVSTDVPVPEYKLTFGEPEGMP